MGQKIKESESYWVINIRDNNLMSSLQKYMRTKKKTVNCITTVDPFLLGGESILLKAKWKDKSHLLQEDGVRYTQMLQEKVWNLPSVFLK